MHEEELLGKAYDKNLMKRLLKYLKPYKKMVFIAIVLNMLIAGFGPLRPYLTKIAIDDFILKNKTDGFFNIIGLILLSLVLQSVIQYFNVYFTQLIGQKTIFDLRMEIFSYIQKLSSRFFDKTPVGRLVTRVTNDVEVLNELFSSGIVMVFSDIFIIIWILIFMFMMDVKLSLATLSVLPILILMTMWFRKGARDSYRKVRVQIAKINSFIQEHISGISVVQSFIREKSEFGKFKKINESHASAHIRSIFYYAIFYPSVEFLSAVAIGLIIWFVSGEIIQNTISLGVLISFIQYTEMFFRPIRDLSEKYNVMQSAMASSERIFKLLDDKTLIVDEKNILKNFEINEESLMEFKNVWFCYDDDSGKNKIENDETIDKNKNWVLKNVSFTIEFGKSTAFVGATGSGKSTIVNLLLRFYEIQHGEILINGIDIRFISQSDLRKMFSVVLQDVFLFSGTIKDNITLGRNFSIEEIKNVSEMIGCNNFIEKLPNQYDEKVTERGSTLSVGQKQLLSFSRSLISNPQVLILDEATSNIDTESEIIIQNAIDKMLENRTSILIAHRLSTIQHANKIIVLHKGEIREIGNHQELLKLGGIYFKLYQLQYKSQEILT